MFIGLQNMKNLRVNFWIKVNLSKKILIMMLNKSNLTLKTQYCQIKCSDKLLLMLKIINRIKIEKKHTK